MTMRTLTLILTGIALSLAATPSLAQTVRLCGGQNAQGMASAGQTRLTAAVQTSEDRISVAPTQAAVSRPQGLEISTGAEGGIAIFKFGGQLPTSVHCADDYQVARSSVWSVAVSAPLNDDSSDDNKVANLDGLAGSTAVEFNFRRLSIRARASITKADMEAICNEAWAALGDEQKAATPRINGDCTEIHIQEWHGEDGAAFREALWGKAPSASVWGISGKVGQEDFDYYDPATLAKLSDHKTGWSMKLYYAYKPLFHDRLFTLQYEHQRAWEGQEENILCPVGGPTSDCVKGAPGKPSSIDKELFSADYRQRFEDKAFALTLTYDAANEVAAVGLPIYLTAADKDGLIGGIRFDWRSDTNESTAAIFIAKPLNFDLP